MLTVEQILQNEKSRSKQIKTLLDKKEELINSLGAKAIQYGKERVQGGAEVSDRFADVHNKIQDIDDKVMFLYKQSEQYHFVLQYADDKTRNIIDAHFSKLRTNREIAEEQGVTIYYVPDMIKRCVIRITKQYKLALPK